MAPLQYSFVVSDQAQKKAEDMAKRHYFEHHLEGEDTWQFLTVKYSVAEENLAMGFFNANKMIDAWLQSEGHRKNLLNAGVSQIGIGIARDGEQWIIVQNFIQPVPKIGLRAKFGAVSYYSYRIGDYDSTDHLVAAARDFPRGSYVNACSEFACVRVKITDFGPEKAKHPDRILDLSPRAFKVLSPSGSLKEGVLRNIMAEPAE